MKKIICLNYLLMIVSWCLYLNHYIVPAFMLLLLTSIYLLLKLGKFNYLQAIFTYVISTSLMMLLFKLTNLHEYFSLFDEYLVALGLNISLSNQCLKKVKTTNLYPICLGVIIVMFIFIIISVVLPDSLYTLFTKTNIYALIILIFMPYSVSITYVLLKKQILVNNLKEGL